MRPQGFITCFKCKGQRTLPNGSKPAIRKLEVFRKGRNPKKKGKLIAEAWVCVLCYADGYNRVPLGEFNGEFKYAPMNPKILDIAKEGIEKLEKMKEEKQGDTPMYPTKK